MRSYNREVRWSESGDVRVKKLKAGGRVNGDGLEPLCLLFLFLFVCCCIVRGWQRQAAHTQHI